MRSLLVLLITLALLAPFCCAEENTGVTITITAVGDCTLGGVANHTASSEKLFAKTCDANGYGWFFEKVLDIFESDDFTVINLEGPLTTATEYDKTARFCFRGRPADVQILTCSSVEVATLANNHSHNFLQAGFDETVSVLKDAGVGVCAYEEVYYAECKGITVGFCGFDEWYSDNSQITQVVAEARANCNLLIVCYHGGVENNHRMSDRVRSAGQLAIDLGADLVIGNHSHVMGGIEIYKGKYIIGSLGNFCFGGNTDPKELECTIFRQSFTVYPYGRVEDAGIDILPALVSTITERNNCQPCVNENEYKARNYFNSLIRLSNFKASDVNWLIDSYAVRCGLDK